MIHLKTIKSIVLFLLLVPLFNLWGQTREAPSTTVSFQKIQLLDKYISEGASIGDIDMDRNGPSGWHRLVLCLGSYSCPNFHEDSGSDNILTLDSHNQ